MKKILLLLSCCFATWCSVQAGLKYSASSSEMSSAESRTMLLNSAMAAPSNASGSISSITYDSSTSEITIKYKTTNASSASLNFLSIQKGGVINSSPISIPVSNTSYTTKKIYIDTTWPESLFKVYLYVNGSVAGQISNGRVYPCFESQVTIPVKGSIKETPKYNNGKLPVSYTLQHGSPYSSIRIYNSKGEQVYRQNVSSTNVNTFKNITISKELNAGTYTCRLYSNDKELDRKSFEVAGPTPPTPSEPYWSTVITKLTQMSSSKIKADFTLKDTGVNVVLRLFDTKSYTTRDFNLGKWTEHKGTYDLDIPSNNGPALYVVTIFTNGQQVNGAQINTTY